MKTDIFKISDRVAKKENEEKIDAPVVADEAADFETALAATGFGKFNFILLIIAFPAALAPVFESTTMSFVFPAAQCDLDLSLQNKGTLNAITYLGMITSGLFWGFFADTFGRKKLLIIGYYLDTLVVLCSGLSQSFAMLVTFKYFGGFVINGPFAVLTAYLSEFHSAKYRARVQILMGLIVSVASIILPVLAWGMFQVTFNLNFLNLSIHNWNVFLFLCALPSFISGTTILFMPESPKFLMTMGANDKALQAFKKVYALNTGNAADSYPIKKLINETELQENEKRGKITANRTKVQAIKEGWQQIACIFHPSYRCKVVLVCLIQTALISGINTIRLWLPQIFVAIVNYQNKHNGESSSLCEMLSMVQANVTFVQGEKLCEVDVSSLSPYVNSIIVSVVGVVGCLAAGVIINKVQKKLLLVALSITSLAFSLGLYFSQGTISILVLTSIFQTTAGVAASILLNIAVEIFPTTIRTIALSLVMLFARIGALTGNMLLPILLEVGCLPPFVLEGALFAVATILSLLLPRTDRKALE